MKRVARIAGYVVVAVSALVVLVLAAALIVSHTGWFRNYAREQIVAGIEDGLGGRVEVGSFDFDAGQLRATVRNLVVHGREPANAAPFLRVSSATVQVRLLTRLNRLVDISNLAVEKPEANIIMLADGSTNLPTPRDQTPSKNSPLKTVVDLAIGHFDLDHGSVALEQQKIPLNAHVNNLRAQLAYNLLAQTYQGKISFAPVYVVAAKNTPVTVNVSLPLTIGSDRIELHQASISTAASTLSIDGTFENVKSPRVDARIHGSIALADVKNAGDVPIVVNARGVPSMVQVAADVAASKDSIRITQLNTTVGATSIQGADDNGAFRFQSTMDLGEMGRLFAVAERPEGTVTANGSAQFSGAGNYSVTGDLRASHLAFQESGAPGASRIRNVDLASKVSVNPSDLELTGLVLSAFGGKFEGNASLNDWRRYEVHGNLQSLDLKNALATLGTQVPYDGYVAGAVTAAGDTQDAKSLIAQARLTIAPGKRGIPVSGRVNADYSDAANNLTIRNSYLALPHSRVDFDGSIGKQLNVSLKSQDLNDLLAAAMTGPPPVALDHGDATFTGVVTGGLNAPRISGHLAANRFSVEGRKFDSLAADVGASGTGVSVSNGALTRAGTGAPMQAQFSASAGLSAWKLLPRNPVKADLSIGSGDLADLVALAGQPSTDYSGAITAAAHVSGTAGNPVGTVSLQASKGTIDGQVFDQAQMQANLTDRLVTIPAAFVQSGSGRIDLSGEFRHPADSFSTGHLQAKVAGNQIDLATSIGRERKNTSGRVSLNLNAEGDLKSSEFLVSKVDGNVSASAVKFDGESYGDLSANIRTSGQTVTYTLTSNFAGSNVRANGSTQLVKDYPTTADLSIANLAVDKALQAVNQSDIPARGTLSGALHLTGTLSDPHGNGDIELTKAVVYDEPIDRLQVKAAYLAQSIDVSQCRITAGDSQVELTAHFDHPVGNLRAGNASFNVNSSHVDLARIHNIQTRRPGLAGAVELSAKGSGTISNEIVAGADQEKVTLHDLNLNLAATGVHAEGQNFGDLKLTANTTSGSRVDFALDSSLADAAIHGHGTATLTTGYPVNAQLTFSNVLYSHIAKLTGSGSAAQPGVEAEADGQITLDGPVANTDQLRANLQITKLSAIAKAGAGNKKPIEIANQGPIVASLDHGNIQIQSAHISGGGADLQASGHATVPAGTLALTVNGTLGLGILPSFDSDIYSAGNVNLNATVRGTMSQPLVNGQLVLKDVAFNYAGMPNGISNANGTIAFNGNSASIQTLTAESGGGKITVTGFAENGDVARFNLRLNATNVRSRVQQGISLVAAANVQLTGTSRSSVVSGTATVEKITYSSQTDIGSLLTRAEPSVEPATAPGQLLENMRLDLRVRTSSALAVQADIAEGLSATADLKVQGTALRPAVLGRITINEGKIVFFGSSYNVDAGTIAFYNPLRIDPILDVSLATQTQGIDVTLRVTGPVDNMKLSYTSNPPLQFQEIVGLLAAGRTPTSDPTLLANQPQVPQASFEQMGESALLGQAVANPAAGRLQRVFGISQLKIDPAFEGGSSTPTARVTLQQRITSNLTFTYTSALDDPNGEIVKVEWAFDPRFSAVATRDQNGIFSVNFFYKRQFH